MPRQLWIEGLTELRRAFETAPDKLKAELKPIVDLRAQKLLLTARQRAPVLTGALRDSLTARTRVTQSGVVAHVTTDKYYAVFVEFGTYYQRAKPFLRSSSEQHRDPFVNDLRGMSRQVERAFTSSLL